MARFRRAVVLAAVVLELLGCTRQPVAPASTANPPPPAASAANRPPPAAPWLIRDISRWRPAVEDYVPAVRPETTGRLNVASFAPFVKFLTQVHTRIHPIFSDQFLAELDALPSSNPMNQGDLRVKLEIVLERDGGRIHRMGVVASSGITAFDVSALESVDRAQPFGAPPKEIVSPDGFVYFHWEFHRGPEACGTWNAHPYLLKAHSDERP